jgi:hypothetical protein
VIAKHFKNDLSTPMILNGQIEIFYMFGDKLANGDLWSTRRQPEPFAVGI